MDAVGFKPDFYEEEELFKKSYKQASTLSALLNPRSTVIAVSVFAGVASMTSDKICDALPFCNRQDEETTESDLAPKSSVRPVPRPDFR